MLKGVKMWRHTVRDVEVLGRPAYHEAKKVRSEHCRRQSCLHYPRLLHHPFRSPIVFYTVIINSNMNIFDFTALDLASKNSIKSAAQMLILPDARKVPSVWQIDINDEYGVETVRARKRPVDAQGRVPLS